MSESVSEATTVVSPQVTASAEADPEDAHASAAQIPMSLFRVIQSTEVIKLRTMKTRPKWPLGD